MEDNRKSKTMGEILKDEFMIPLNISAYKLAKETNVPVSRIQDLLHDRRKITADTSIRLGKYFGLGDRFFLNIQCDIDIKEAKEQIGNDIDKIKPLFS